MARLKTVLEPSHKEQLVKRIYQTFGKPLTHSFECEVLSAEIQKVTGCAVSPNTLRRLLGFLESPFQPSIKTLNTLAVYTGFANWHSFTDQPAPLAYEPLTLDGEAAMYLDFYKIDMKEEADMNYHSASRNIAFRILFNPGLLAKLAPALARNPVSQVYFFERFPYIDGLCTDYKRSLQLYMQKKNPEAQLFGNCLLFLSAFLGNAQKDLKIYIDRINQYELAPTMHPFIVARYIGSNLLYQQTINGNITLWLTEAMKWNTYFMRKRDNSIWSYPYFQHMMAVYLNLARLFDESYQVIRSSRQATFSYQIERGYVEALEVVYQLARHPSSGSDFIHWFETTDLFQLISPMFKKYHLLQALCIYYSLLPAGRKKQKTIERINELISTTGFIHFQKYIA